MAPLREGQTLFKTKTRLVRHTKNQGARWPPPREPPRASYRRAKGVTRGGTGGPRCTLHLLCEGSGKPLPPAPSPRPSLPSPGVPGPSSGPRDRDGGPGEGGSSMSTVSSQGHGQSRNHPIRTSTDLSGNHPIPAKSPSTDLSGNHPMPAKSPSDGGPDRAPGRARPKNKTSARSTAHTQIPGSRWPPLVSPRPDGLRRSPRGHWGPELRGVIPQGRLGRRQRPGARSRPPSHLREGGKQGAGGLRVASKGGWRTSRGEQGREEV